MENNTFLAIEAMLNANIRTIRGKRAMLLTDIAKLYEVTPEELQQQVKKNRKRFPEDFMFLLTKKEQALLKTTLPYAFTEKGILQAGGQLRSPRAVKVHIQMIEYFVHLCKSIPEALSSGDKETAALFNILKQMTKD